MLGDLARSIAATRGLARIDKALGMVVAYATAADEVAADGSGRNSPFTTAFLRRLQEPGLEIGTMFRRIAADVNERTGGRQRPETYVSLIGEYYSQPEGSAVWTAIKDSSDPVAFRNFVAKFPSSPRVSDAQYRLEMLERFARQGMAPASSSTSQSAVAPADTPTKDLTIVRKRRLRRLRRTRSRRLLQSQSQHHRLLRRVGRFLRLGHAGAGLQARRASACAIAREP